MHDPSGRRGIWFRLHEGVFQLRSGREGDDGAIDWKAGQVLTEKDLEELIGALSDGAWMQEDNGPDCQFDSLQTWNHGGLEELKAFRKEEQQEAEIR